MNKRELKIKTEQTILDTKNALQTVYDALNRGQQKQIIKNEKVKDFANKMTEPCYNVCKKTKDFVIKYYEKVKNYFSKKS